MLTTGQETAGASSRTMDFNPVTLRFTGKDKALESLFLDEYFEKSLSQARGSLYLILFYYLFFGLLDSRLLADSTVNAVFTIRFLIVGPIITLALFLTYAKFFKLVMQPVLAAVMFITGAGIVMVLIIAPPPLNFAYYVGLILVFIHAYTFTKIRFIWASLAGWGLVILYEIVTVWVIYTPAAILIGNNFLLICASVVGMLTCYSMEYFERKSFWLNHQLLTEHEKVNQANQELEQEVARRTQEITRANQDLSLKIEQNLRIMEKLKESRDFAESLIKSLQDGLAVFSPEGRHLEVNPAFCHMTGFSREEILDMSPPHAYWAPEDKAMLTRAFANSSAVSRPSGMETALVRRDGTRIQILISLSPIRHEGEDLTGYVVTFKDINARKMAEQALAHSEARYRAILASMEELYFELDLFGRFIFVNDAVMRFTGYSREELLGLEKGWYNLTMDGDRMFGAFSTIYASGQTAVLEDFPVLARGGTEKFAQISAYLMRDKEGNPMGFKGLGRDITESMAVAREKKLLESQLRQSQKMEAVGTLAGGIAHDFNNILSAIMAYTEAMLMEPDDRTKNVTRLEHVKKASLRARELIRQILTFSRSTEHKKTPVSLPFVTREALKLLRASLPSTIKIQYRAEEKMGRVMADPTQIHQVLMNLCGNAEHAMRKNGGVLDVSLDTVFLPPGEAAPHVNLSPGRYIRLSVADTGQGMSPDVKKRIFDPYYTTKEKGEGTGLGLAVVHGIVEAGQGAVTVESEVGRGACFRVYLPETLEKEEIQESAAGDVAGDETILLVDDESDLLDSYTALFRHYGYHVSAHQCSSQAFARFMSGPEQFDLVVTDQTMPELTGLELAAKIMKVRPGLPVILCTGYSSDAGDEQSFEKAGIRKMIMKPFAFDEFMKDVRKILDEEKAAPAKKFKKPSSGSGRQGARVAGSKDPWPS
ncbi:PAS domain S-box protein [Desulfatibacillum aliphaticivorans]|uniref:PAS domain S-box protein n=1 Tax=Desulfatibacillum aliphaticivorans TaxID=218208 RepID=UPI000A0750F1|nr:PAS domain S-box protein [Desulfatibacillum aliphaticivorans]